MSTNSQNYKEQGSNKCKDCKHTDLRYFGYLCFYGKEQLNDEFPFEVNENGTCDKWEKLI